MARPLPVNMLLAGTGAVLLVSGIGGKSIGDVLKGSFGKLEVKNPAIGSEPEQAGGEQQAALGGGGSQFAPSPVSFTSSFSGATLAPSPQSLSRHPSTGQTKDEQAKEIARILLEHGITHPSSQQLAQARAQYEREGGHKQFEGSETDTRGRPFV